MEIGIPYSLIILCCFILAGISVVVWFWKKSELKMPKDYFSEERPKYPH